MAWADEAARIRPRAKSERYETRIRQLLMLANSLLATSLSSAFVKKSASKRRSRGGGNAARIYWGAIITPCVRLGEGIQPWRCNSCSGVSFLTIGGQAADPSYRAYESAVRAGGNR